MSILKTPYEISLWDDILTLVDINGNEYDSDVPEDVEIKTSYFKEKKLFVIGANNISSNFNVFNPHLKKEVNGNKTLTFSIYSKYYDESIGDFVDNPFLPFLINERKVKLKSDKNGQIKWYDFIIKNIQENSEDYTYTYTATDLFINELSKTGFNLEFDASLKNGAGTVNELGAMVLKDTDWHIGAETEILQEFQEEPLYKLILNRDILVHNLETKEAFLLEQGKIIYAFYSSIINEEKEFFQFLYNKNDEYLIDDDRLIYNADNYFVNLSIYEVYNKNFPYISDTISYTNEYRGKRLIRSPKIVYDNILERYVNVCIDNQDREIYGYTETEYITEKTVESYISNGSNFVSTNGWKQRLKKDLPLIVSPSFEEVPLYDIERQSYLEYDQIVDNFLLNTGLNNNSTKVKEIGSGENFVFRIKAKVFDEETKVYKQPSNVRFRVQIKSYGLKEDGSFLPDSPKTRIILDGFTEKIDPEGYFIARNNLKTQAPVTEEELKKEKYGIFITANFEYSDQLKKEKYYIEDVQFFRYVLDGQGALCLPGGKTLWYGQIKNSTIAYFQEKGYYYYPEDAESKNNVKYTYITTGLETDIVPNLKYSDNFEKVRTFTASQSNRFNLLQNLSELFECWCKIEVKHKPTGEILLGKDVDEKILYGGTSTKVMNDVPIYQGGSSSLETNNFFVSHEVSPEYRQQKFITFHKDIGQINNVDFVYGINIKSIVRDIESEEIVTKLIVKSNNNEFAKYGSCNIARAKNNPTGENFIINFDYFVNKGLLNKDNLYNDLYSLNSKKWLGYFIQLKKINIEIEQIAQELSAINIYHTKTASEYQVAQQQYEASIEELRQKEEYFFELTQLTYDSISVDSKWLKDKTVVSLGNIISNLRLENENLYQKYKTEEANYKLLEDKIKELNNKIDQLISKKEDLNNIFNKKYSRFIQEGTWTSEEYTDDDLYFIDAEQALSNSSQPKISYNINVVELSQLEGFENYTYDLGDITHVQDPDFFGWTFKEGVKVPYREKIVVTETSTYFDEPEKDSIKVQNFRTQFEDLFQRLSAATQQIQYNYGSYDRAAGIVNNDGSLSQEALEKAFNENTHFLQNIKNQSVIWDESGISTKNNKNTAEVVRITSGGIYFTNDGGNTWTTGITGEGINANTITTGQLNTQIVSIFNKNQSSFRWDSLGISAYYKNANDYYDNKTFVRFDQYGIYGIKELSDSFSPDSEEQIWSEATFALTWKGFMLKNSGDQGTISIDSENDFNVYDAKGKKLIHIGKLDNQESYGIEIKDTYDRTALLATQDGLITGGWTVEPGGFYSISTKDDTEYEIGLFSRELDIPVTLFEDTDKPVEKSDWRIIVGNNFGVDFSGNLYASNANITGTINATSGTIGGLTITDGILLVPGDKIDGIDIKDEEENILLLAKKSENLVQISDWEITKEGLYSKQYSENNYTVETTITPKKVKIKYNSETDSGEYDISWLELAKKMSTIEI